MLLHQDESASLFFCLSFFKELMCIARSIFREKCLYYICNDNYKTEIWKGGSVYFFYSRKQM